MSLEPGARVGILGGGQLGRMLAMAAGRLGLDAVIFDPAADGPAARVAAEHVTAAYDDLAAVEAFARSVDVVTYEFENVPVEAAQEAGRHAPLRPGFKALETAQDRVIEKTFLNKHGAPTVAFRAVSTAQDVRAAAEALGTPAILKTRRFGYDGKGQAVIQSPEEAEAAFDSIGAQPAILEAFAPFKRELSVIAARSVDGQIAAFPVGENRHSGGILRQTFAPAEISEATASEAHRIVSAVLSALDYVGVIGVELFELEGGALLVNEIAPRVHNTGHWTMDGCACDQFEQHIRAVAGWTLGQAEALTPTLMLNLIGSEAEDWQRWLNTPNAALHLYGKGEARPGRKMGHVNILHADGFQSV